VMLLDGIVISGTEHGSVATRQILISG